MRPCRIPSPFLLLLALTLSLLAPSTARAQDEGGAPVAEAAPPEPAPAPVADAPAGPDPVAPPADPIEPVAPATPNGGAGPDPAGPMPVTADSETSPAADAAPGDEAPGASAPAETAPAAAETDGSAPADGGGSASALTGPGAPATGGPPVAASASAAETLLAKLTGSEPPAGGTASPVPDSTAEGAGSATADEKPAKTGSGGFDLFGAAASLKDKLRSSVAGNPVTLTDTQRSSLEKMRPVLSQMAGPDGKLNRADTDSIVKALEPDLGQRVRQEISRRAEAKINEGRFPGIRSIFVNANVNNNYCDYFNQGMGTARGMVRSGLEEFYSGVGVEGQGTPQAGPPRKLSLAQMDDFKNGAETLRAIDKQRNAKVKVRFPSGFGVDDLDSILKDPNKPPPGGKIAWK